MQSKIIGSSTKETMSREAGLVKNTKNLPELPFGRENDLSDLAETRGRSYASSIWEFVGVGGEGIVDGHTESVDEDTLGVRDGDRAL